MAAKPVQAPPAVAAKPTAAELRQQQELRCASDLKAFSTSLSQQRQADAQAAAYRLFANNACSSTQLYQPVWNLLDVSKEPNSVFDYIGKARASNLSSDQSPAGLLSRDYLQAVEDYLSVGKVNLAEQEFHAIDSRLQQGVLAQWPELNQLAQSDVAYLFKVIAELQKEQAAFDACSSFWGDSKRWQPEELKTGLYYHLASRIHGALDHIWTGLNDMRSQRKSSAAASDPFQTVPVSPKLFEARVMLDELSYEFSKPDNESIVEEFQIELLPEFALKGVNDIIEAYYAEGKAYRGQFQSGLAYLNRANSLVQPFMQDVQRRIAASRYPGCAGQFK